LIKRLPDVASALSLKNLLAVSWDQSNESDNRSAVRRNEMNSTTESEKTASAPDISQAF
jgi:hypothetical protein